MNRTSNHRTGKLFRSAAIVGITTIAGLSAAMVGIAAIAPAASAVPICPRFTTCPEVSPTTRPPTADPGVLDPGNGTVDPGTGTPPSTTPPTTAPPTTTPPITPTNGGPSTNTNNANTGGAQGSTNERPAPAAEATSVDETQATTTNPASSENGGGLPIIAILGGVAALGAAGTGLYLRYARRA